MPEHAGLASQLDAGIAALALDVDAAARVRMLAYLDLLGRWNRAFNLTAVREPADMVGQHLLDSLTALPHIVGSRLLDIGTGAGLPGLVLAIARPALRCILLDAGGKKTRFCRQAVAELGVANAEVVNVRVESYRPGQGFDTITARAFAPLARLVELATPLLAPGGRLLALKGPRADTELAELPPGAGWRAEQHLVQVPGVAGERRLVVVDGLVAA